MTDTNELTQEPCSGLSDLTVKLAAIELAEFEAWWPSIGQTIGKVAAWEAWKARGALHTKCRGVARAGCDYLSACGYICNKCGHTH